MPSYTFRCETCKACTDVISSLRNRDVSRKCPQCGKEMKRMFDVPQRVWAPTRNL